MLFCYVCILLGVAFFTLLERKALSYSQNRKGPNKAGLRGIPQPLSDGLKLLSKELVIPINSNRVPFIIAPVLRMFLALCLWLLYPRQFSLSFCYWAVLFFFCVSSINVYGTLIAGWASNSKYALLGCLRAVAQSISYEIRLVIIVLLPILLHLSFRFFSIRKSQCYIWYCFILFPIFCMWFVSCLAETNRAPFDFAEGESELVSGFNVEYGGVGFTLIFLAEYINIIVISIITSIIFLGGAVTTLEYFDCGLGFKTLFFSFIFIWMRTSFPRYRYDLLMNLTWKAFLPISLSVFIVLSPLMSILAVSIYSLNKIGALEAQD